MDFIKLFTGYIQSELLILIPFTWVVGKAIKNRVVADGDNIVKKLIKSTSSITGALYILDILAACLLGLLFSSRDGWKLFIEAVFVYGLLYGSVCCFIATKLYDKVREE